MSTCIENSTAMSNETIKTLMVDMTTAHIVWASLSGLTAILHMIGVVLLWLLKSELNQILILINLAVAEMMLYLNLATLSIFTASQIPYMSLTMLFFLAIRMLMVILVGDRFVEIFLNIKYPMIITRERVSRLIILIWITSSVYGLSFGLFTVFGDTKSGMNTSFYIHNYITVTIDAVFTICAIITYSYFYMKIRKIAIKDHSQRPNRTLKCGRNFNYKIPFLIVATYLAFNVTSTALFQLRHYEHVPETRDLLLNLAKFFQIAGSISDAFIYIGLQENVINFFKRKIMTRKHNQSR